jgi:hypothetical protein
MALIKRQLSNGRKQNGNNQMAENKTAGGSAEIKRHKIKTAGADRRN